MSLGRALLHLQALAPKGVVSNRQPTKCTWLREEMRGASVLVACILGSTEALVERGGSATLKFRKSGLRDMEERSAGAIVFNQNGGSRKYLLLQNAGHWDFPKGNIEEGESDIQTVLREVREETGLSEIVLVDGFRRAIEYFYRRGNAAIHKRVVFLLARTNQESVRISSEHQDYGWFTYPDALVKTTHDNSRKLLVEAERFVSSMGEAGLRSSELN